MRIVKRLGGNSRHKYTNSDEASGRKMTDFMMDGLCLGAFDAIFRTVRKVFSRFSDGRSGKVSVFSQKNWNFFIHAVVPAKNGYILIYLFINGFQMQVEPDTG